MLMNKELVQFAAGNTEFYEGAMSYFCDKKQSVENKGLLQEAFLAEVERKSGVSRSGNEISAWLNNPNVQWAAFAIVDRTINAILPISILPQFSLFADFRLQNFGDITKFKILPGSFYTVSLDGRGQRTTLRQKKGASDITVAPKGHIVTIFSDLFRVLADMDNIADFMGWLLISVESEMYKDAIGALNTGLEAIPAGDLNVTGSIDLGKLVTMCELVEARNGGAPATIVGSATALMKVLPDSTLGYRVNVGSEGGRIELLKDIVGYDVMRLRNAVDGTGKLVLDANKIYVVSASADKLIKGVMSAAMTNTNQHFDNADITSNFTYRKEWDFVYASAAKAGVYNITD